MKKILIFVGIIAVLIIGYFVFFNKTPQNTAGTSTLSSNPLQTSSQSEQIGREFLSTLLNLNNITLDKAKTVLASPVFSSLDDFTIEINRNEGDEGRDNPFAPIGTDVSALSNDQTSTATPTASASKTR